MKPTLRVFAAVTLALGLGGMAYVARRTPLSAKPSDVRASDDGARVRDALQNDAAVPRFAPPGFDTTIIVFSDYQCPLALIEALSRAGVGIDVCSYALANAKIAHEQVAKGVKIDLAAMVTLSTLQLKGWVLWAG